MSTCRTTQRNAPENFNAFISWCYALTFCSAEELYLENGVIDC